MKLIFTIVVSIFSLHLVHTASVEKYKSYKNYKVIQVTGHKDDLKDLVEALKEEDDSVIHESTFNDVQILIAPYLVPILDDIVSQKVLSSRIVFDDFSKIIKEETRNKFASRRKFSWNAYYDVDDIYEYIRTTQDSYPDSTEIIVGGKSFEGRQILGLRINTPSPEAKPVMFIESGIHAREWIAPATTTYFINQLLTNNDTKIMELRDLFDWRIFPTVNPDGYHYTFTRDRMWRKTRSRSPNGCYGADPNRNWDYNWGKQSTSSNPCDYQVYAGAKPFSEIETKSLSEYIASIDNLLGYVAFHSTGQMLLLPYSDSKEHMDNYDDLVKIGNTSLNYGYEVNHEKYDGPATAAEILYAASGGSMDWVRNALGTDLVFTYELRGYFFHWPPSKIYQQGDEVTQMLLGLVTEARNLGYA